VPAPAQPAAVAAKPGTPASVSSTPVTAKPGTTPSGQQAPIAVKPAPGQAAVAAAPAPALPAPATAKPAMPAPPQPVASVTRTAQGPTLVPPAPAVPQADAPAYETKGRRDPFTTLETVAGPTGLTVATTKLTGIVRGKSTLALVETSDGIGYILRTGDTLGDGRLVEIGADTVVFAVSAKPGAPPSRVVLKLAAK